MKSVPSSGMVNFLQEHANRLLSIGSRSEAAKQIIAMSKQAPTDEARLFVLHGLWAHEKALAAGLKIHSFLMCPDLLKWPEVASVSTEFMIRAERCYIISEKTYARISAYDDPDGILSLAHLPEHKPSNLSLDDEGVVFVLDGLTKPGNIGVIIRSCDGAGISAILTCHLRTRVTHPNAIKASMGAAFSLPIVDFDDAHACKTWLLQNGFTIYIADPNAAPRYNHLPYRGKIALVLGNEHRGASHTWYDGSAKPLSIPMNGMCDSLNVSVAASIMAYEIQSKKANPSV